MCEKSWVSNGREATAACDKFMIALSDNVHRNQQNKTIYPSSSEPKNHCANRSWEVFRYDLRSEMKKKKNLSMIGVKCAYLRCHLMTQSTYHVYGPTLGHSVMHPWSKSVMHYHDHLLISPCFFLFQETYVPPILPFKLPCFNQYKQIKPQFGKICRQQLFFLEVYICNAAIRVRVNW